MTDSIKDSDIEKLVTAGKVYGDGAILRHEQTAMLLKRLADAKNNLHGPKVEVVPHSPRIKPNDFKVITEELITNTICSKWGETPDTLMAINISKLTGNPVVENMIVSEVIDSTKAPDNVKKVTYQFVRRGDYDEVSFENTEILRFEFSELKPNENLKDISTGEVAEQTPDDGVSKSILSDNQFIDIDTGMLVTYYSTRV